MAIMIFCQNLGGAVFLIAAQSIFSNSLRNQIAAKIPGIDPKLILTVGARSVRDIVSGEQLIEVLKAYNTAINGVMYLGAGIGVMSLVCAPWLGWKDIRVAKKKKEDKEEDEGAGEDSGREKSEEEPVEQTV